MCVICEGASPQEIHAGQRERIERYGFTMLYVEPDDDHPLWLYTIGLVEHDHPELAVMGLPAEVAGDIVGELARHVVDGHDFLADDTLSLFDVAGTGQALDVHLQAVDHRLWNGDMFAGWYRYYEWLGVPMPEPDALELVPCGSQPTVAPLAAVRPSRRATNRRHASVSGRHRPLTA